MQGRVKESSIIQIQLKTISKKFGVLLFSIFLFLLRNVVSLLTLIKTLLIAFTSVYLVKVYLQNRWVNFFKLNFLILWGLCYYCSVLFFILYLDLPVKELWTLKELGWLVLLCILNFSISFYIWIIDTHFAFMLDL